MSGGFRTGSEYWKQFNMNGLRIRREGDGPGGVVGTHEGDVPRGQQCLERLRPKDSKFKVCLGYRVNLRPVWIT